MEEDRSGPLIWQPIGSVQCNIRYSVFFREWGKKKSEGGDT